MIYELLATALLACSIGPGINKDDPKRATATFPFLGTYTLSCNITSNGDYFVVTSPMGNEARANLDAYDTYFTATSSDGFATITAKKNSYQPGDPVTADIVLGLKANTDVNDERLNQSFAFMQEDNSYALGDNVELNEFAIDGTPEISLSFSWSRDQVVTSTFTFPMTYQVAWEGFGILEYDSEAWVKQGASFYKAFNAIYVDNTEPKLYAFWLDRYMLARQVRLNGDIINQNYVTASDGLDPSFGKQVIINFTPSEDVSLKVSAIPYEPTWSLTNDYNRGYNNGYADGKDEGQKPVSWIRSVFGGLASFFSIEVFPYVSLGFLAFSPLFVVAIIAIVRIFRHD